ncbi:MAG: hypothetical protein AB4911_23410 [Oscillochloridaceae bacterium umkhey_bin13]
MLTIEQIITYVERTIAERYLADNKEGLRRIQLALGELIAAAEAFGDRETALRLRVLAAKAANQREALQGEE